MEISTGASTRRPERLSLRDDRLVLAAAAAAAAVLQNKLEGAWSCKICTQAQRNPAWLPTHAKLHV